MRLYNTVTHQMIYKDSSKDVKKSLAKAVRRRVDLSFVNLRGLDLRNVNLKKAKLHAADLEGANLEGANLECASCVRANLTNANLDIKLPPSQAVAP